MSHGRSQQIAKNSDSQHRRDGILAKALLRNYASNLRRSWRNSPHAAFVDATIQVEALVTVMLVTVLMMFEIMASRTVLPSLSFVVGHTKYTRGTIIVLAIVLIGLWTIDRRLKPYEFLPGAGTAYATSRDRVIVWIYYAAGFAIVMLGLVVSIAIKRAFPL
jgi:hypothetical protein